eukprot:760058-Alexandrium_andersonii.AAC.1
MSASLVGSEMCIRDSGIAHGPLAQTAGSHPRVRAHSPCSLARLIVDARCLLYTSDAADDM